MKIIWTSRFPALLGALVLTALVWALPSAAQAAPDPPQLSIAVDDGQATVGPGDRLTYRVSVTNLGTRRVKDLILTQTVPDGAALVSSGPGSTAKGRDVTWSVDVKPGKKATMTTTVAVAEKLPDGLLRLATVACARTTAKGTPLVCASDSDQLPAGAAADQQRQTLQQQATGDPGWWPLPGAALVGGVVLVSAAVVVAILLLIRRRGRGGPVAPASRAADPAQLVSSSRR